MSRTWDPWRQSDDQPIFIPRHVFIPSIVLPGVESEAEKGQTTLTRQNDFISILALAQHLNVDFLPITWHPAVETLGAGATAEIRQALVDIQTSFAFKRIGLERKDAFTALRSEISVLRTAEVSEHENIISLVGICWDVDPDGPVIWPVLVFEKAPFGNLSDFLQSDLGRQLSTSQVLSMMIDIGRALACLHRNGIVHCDIKPDNLLVFQNDTNQYVIKVADFGYACFITQISSVHLATPAEWTDPTYRGEALNADTAKEMESYSFGLVCAWLLREASIHRASQISVTPASSAAQSAKLEDWSAVLAGISNPGADQIRNLRKFFSLTLAADRAQRSTDFSKLIRLLEDISDPVADEETRQKYQDDVPPTASLSSLHIFTESNSPEFQISRSLFRLLQTDFRLPGFIVKQLQEQVSTLADEETRSNAQFQLAVCYTIGFGVCRSLEHSRQWLSACEKSDEDLEAQIEQLRAENRWPYQNERVQALDMAGSLGVLDARFLQDAVQILKSAELHYREQLRDFQHVFDPAHQVNVLIRSLLGNVLYKDGQYEEAYHLFLDLGHMMEDGDSGWGPLHRATLATWTQAGAMALSIGKDAEAESLYSRVYEGQSLTLGLLHPETLLTVDNLALVFEHQGKYLEAEKLSREALDGSKRVFGNEHPHTLHSSSNLSTILVSAGKLREARSLLEESVSARKRIFGRGNADTMNSQSNLSAIYNLMGDLSKAEILGNEVLQEMEEIHGSNHPDTLSLLGNLASTMHGLGRNDRARELGNRLLEQKHLIGVDNPYLLTIMSNMTVMLQEEDRFEESLELDGEILQRRIELLGEEHPDTILTHNNIATALHRQGKYKEAKEIYEKILGMRKDILGENHPATIDTRNNLAFLLQQMGHYDAALILYEDAMKRSTETLGPDHPRTLNTKYGLGTMYLLLGNTAGAVDIFRHTIEAQLKSLGESHSHTLQSMDTLAVALHKLGQNEEAERYFRQEIQNESVLGTKNSLMLSARNNLGMLLSGEGRYEEARECISRALAGRETLLGPDHPETVTSLFNMACVDFRQDQYGPAMSGFRTVVGKRKDTLGFDHPDTLHAMEFLAEVLGRIGQYDEAEKFESDLCKLTKQRYGDDHPKSLAASLRVALILQKQGRLIEAEEILVRVVGASRQQEDEEARQQLSSRYHLARVRGGLGKYNEAEEDLRYVLQGREQDLGMDHEDTLNVVNALGLVLRNLRRLDEASQLLDRALKGREKIRGNEIQVLETLALQALVRQDQGDVDAAIQLNTRALVGRERLLGPEHPTTLGVVNNLALLAFQKMDGPETLKLHRRVMEGREKVLGPLHPDTIASIRALGAVTFRIGFEEEALLLFERAYSSIYQLYGADHPKSKAIKEEMSGIRYLIDDPKHGDVEQKAADVD